METIEMKPIISVDSFFALDIRFCQITEVENILKKPKKEFDEETNPVKAYKLTVNTGFDIRTIVTNIVHISQKELVGTITPFILNFEPAMIRGFESRGMIYMYDPNIVIEGFEIGKIVV